MANGEQWADARRIEEWAGEVRVNLIRLAAVLVFYGHHLLQHYLFRDEATRDVEYHVLTTLLVVAWSTEVLALHLCLSRRWLPPWLKYAATACDIGLIGDLILYRADWVIRYQLDKPPADELPDLGNPFLGVDGNG
jgi:hypothetical protein